MLVVSCNKPPATYVAQKHTFRRISSLFTCPLPLNMAIKCRFPLTWVVGLFPLTNTNTFFSISFSACARWVLYVPRALSKSADWILIYDIIWLGKVKIWRHTGPQKSTVNWVLNRLRTSSWKCALRRDIHIYKQIRRFGRCRHTKLPACVCVAYV